jgi:hypothetical protein
MPIALLRSPAFVEALLMLMLLAWLAACAAMTLLAGRGARRAEARAAARGGLAVAPAADALRP